jgi:hypothetical protein
VEKAVNVADDTDVECRLPLHRLSPHETNEWAYLTQPISRGEKRTFDEVRYSRVWVRLWQRRGKSTWSIAPNQHNVFRSPVSRDSDGVVYRLRTHPYNQQAIQVGGPGVAWKFIGVPYDSDVMVLLRPRSVSDRRMHPLDVLVASNGLDGAALMTLLQRGDASQARSLSATWLLEDGPRERPELDKLDFTAALAFGYHLIRSSNFQGLSDWLSISTSSPRPPFYSGNSPDYRILRLWQEIDELRQREYSATDAFDLLCPWFVDSPFWNYLPVFSEGLRLVQKALFLFRNARGNSVQYQAFLGIVNAYVGASDPFAVATTFTGARPDEPSAQPIFGIPEGDSVEYVYP